MGLSSNARLLSITARITSNEYEAQQVANSKMRLTAKAQAASEDYIRALNNKKLVFNTYDEKGNPVSEDLTAALLYSYTETKSQYGIANAAGQLLINSADAENFRRSKNLDDFLAFYGIEKQFKSEILKDNYKKMQDNLDAKKAWDNLVQEYMNDDSRYQSWQVQKAQNLEAYAAARSEYETEYNNVMGSTDVADKTRLNELKNAVADARDVADKSSSFRAWAEEQCKSSDEYNNYLEYQKAADAFDVELEKYGSVSDCYTYNDATKAQWYTNLWSRLNGNSTAKTSEGLLESNYKELDPNLYTSSSWMQDALTRGEITIESASYEKATDEVTNDKIPVVLTLKGINWNSRIYSSCSDIKEEDDDNLVAKAEAEYEQKTKEINTKDQKYDAKIKELDTEHEALKTQYDSVKTALNNDIKRSFKVFQG